MKKAFVYIMLTISTSLIVNGCGSSCPFGSEPEVGGDSSVLATINGSPITAAEVDEMAKDQMQRFNLQLYQIRKGALNAMIDDKLIAEAAKKENIDAEEYLKKEVDSKISEPTEEEIKGIYTSKMGDQKVPLENVKDQIANYLKQMKTNDVRNQLIARLRKDAKVEIKIDAPRVDIDTGDAPSVGPKNAKITMIEFSDYQCPFCKRVRDTVWELVDEYKGKIKYVFMDFPLSFHQQSQKAHEASRCAGEQEKYFEYNKKLFSNQTKLSVADLKNYARELKLNTKKFDSCLDEGKYADEVKKSLEVGAKAGVSGTPAYFINGIMISGAQPKEKFVEIIEDELNK